MESKPPPITGKFAVDTIALDRLTGEGAPCPAEPKAACVVPKPKPLWRKYEPLDEQ